MVEAEKFGRSVRPAKEARMHSAGGSFSKLDLVRAGIPTEPPSRVL